MNLQTGSVKVMILILRSLLVMQLSCAKQKAGPTLTFKDSTTCKEFSQTARFNPYAMVNGTWMVFYYWAKHRTVLTFKFQPLTRKDYTWLHANLDEKFNKSIDWTAKHIIMRERGTDSLLVETGDRGQYVMYVPGQHEGKSTPPTELRFKQTGDNKVVGMMVCKTKEVFAMSRIQDIPRQKDLQEVAARLNYRGRGGKSYLYAGHHWMPIPEQDELQFWSRRMKNRFMYD